MGYCYTASGKLVCDLCGAEGAKKVPCPFGYCQAIAACPECRANRKTDVLGREAHRERGCEAAHLQFEATQRDREALLAGGEYVLRSGLGAGDKVQAIFEGKDGSVGRLIPNDIYRLWATRPNPTLSWFEALAGGPFEELKEERFFTKTV
jgi:hypothetical protein